MDKMKNKYQGNTFPCAAAFRKNNGKHYTIISKGGKRTLEDIYVMCGAIVPEGRMVCDNCEAKYYFTSVDNTKKARVKSLENQSYKADAGKPKLSLVPTEIINCIARVREFGNNKYKDSNSWKRVEKERYIDAMFRHLLKYINDNKAIDEESGLPHLWHCACNIAFLCEMEKDME